MSAVLTIVLILLAAVAAFFVGRWHGLSTGSKELTKELESKDKELEALKSGVNEHFDETARLFSNLTEEYKTLYQHLATGANTLSNKEFKLKLSAPVGAGALPSESSASQASATDVIDAEEHLSKEASNKQATDSQQHEEESFIRKDDSSDALEAEETDTDTDTQTLADTNDKPLDKDKPDLDIEVSPPRDWADGDMDDDYHPNGSKGEESEFADLAKEKADTTNASGHKSDKTEPSESNNTTTKA
ncbi:ZapG family protein [Kangiella marina]|uniref:Z-ring associated protein G n=1 Tax=Kangiella marina TaxID=1079178 RepID=A0ABP8IMR8_9GAMM